MNTIPGLDWREMRIGDLGQVLTGNTPPTRRQELFGNVYPFITPTDINSDIRTVTTERFLSDAGKEHFQK